MDRKTQSIGLAMGGFIIILGMVFGKIEFDWAGFIYVGFSMVVGFWNWIELDKVSHKARKEKGK